MKPSEAGATHGVSGTGAVTGILGVQEVDDALAHASKGKMRAQDILDRLEDLRHGTSDRRDFARKIAATVRASSTPAARQITDPRLAEILDEIDLRAQVELAKYAQAQG